jgi:hypothetical protein
LDYRLGVLEARSKVRSIEVSLRHMIVMSPKAVMNAVFNQKQHIQVQAGSHACLQEDPSAWSILALARAAELMFPGHNAQKDKTRFNPFKNVSEHIWVALDLHAVFDAEGLVTARYGRFSESTNYLLHQRLPRPSKGQEYSWSHQSILPLFFSQEVVKKLDALALKSQIARAVDLPPDALNSACKILLRHLTLPLIRRWTSRTLF